MAETPVNLIEPEMRQMLMGAHDEIITLRRKLVELEPKAHAYDTLAQLARLTAHPTNQGYGIDVAWRIKDALEKDTDARRATQDEDHSA